jgi:hypothetical protein
MYYGKIKQAWKQEESPVDNDTGSKYRYSTRSKDEGTL